MKLYTVVWEIEVDAKNHKDAATKALEIMQDPNSSATVFKVKEFNTFKPYKTIDLNHLKS